MLNGLPDLTFPDVKLGQRETPWDQLPFLFKGGTAVSINKITELIAAKSLGMPIKERMSLVCKIHEEIKASLVGGGSKETAKSTINAFRFLFSWADNSNHALNLNSIESTYLAWTDYMLHRVRIIKDIKESTAYMRARLVGAILDKILERTSTLIRATHLTFQSKSIRTCKALVDKQNLADTFAFGHALIDIVDALSLDALWGPLPVHIKFRSGKEIKEWSGLTPSEKLKWPNPQNSKQRYYAKVSMQLRSEYENDRTLRTRYPLVNLRIESELLLFIGETGMNLSQAHQLRVGQYRYKSTIDGYEVSDFKHRRKGEVLFDIFSEYKAVFERYLEWRRAVFPDDEEGLLFPLVRRGGRAVDKRPKFGRIQETCKKIGLKYIASKQLRCTRINWFLRRTLDPELTSQQAQHSVETLLRYYDVPSLQVAMIEITRFWSSNDPAFKCPAPGICNGVPVPVLEAPLAASMPDCIRPTGCLWCQCHCDIDSQDYVWSVASLRYLKILALEGRSLPSDGAKSEMTRYIEMTIELLSAKLQWFRQSNELRSGWVVEALSRIDEASYHPDWHYLITSLEGQ